MDQMEVILLRLFVFVKVVKQLLLEPMMVNVFFIKLKYVFSFKSIF
jgi:hypothetical protein